MGRGYRHLQTPELSSQSVVEERRHLASQGQSCQDGNRTLVSGHHGHRSLSIGAVPWQGGLLGSRTSAEQGEMHGYSVGTWAGQCLLFCP